MDKIRTEIRRFYFRIKHDYMSFDNIIFFVAIVACVFWTYSSLSATSRNWELSQKLDARQKELTLVKLEVEASEVENAYYRSAEYKELSARAKQNKQLPGENLVYLPANSEAALNKYNTQSDDTSEEDEKPSNVSQWMSFLFGV